MQLVEARDLVPKDTYMMGMVKGKSDPYAVLRVGNSQFKTVTIKEDLNPRWTNEVYEVWGRPVYSACIDGCFYLLRITIYFDILIAIIMIMYLFDMG